MSIPKVIVCGICALSVLTFGCARWSSPPSTASLNDALLRPKLGPDTVVFEVTFIRIPADREGFADEFWAEVDETVISTELRRRLAANGFRCGLVGTTLPSVLQEVLALQPVAPSGGTPQPIDPNREVVARTSRMRSRSGQMGKVMVRSNPIEKMAALSLDDDGHVRGESLNKAQFIFTLTSFAQGDGRVDLELIPTIEHGQLKSRFRGENGVWIVDNTTRDVCAFDDMKLQVTLSPGEAIALTCTNTKRGLGGQFFGDDPAEKEPRLLLMVRLQQTQQDNRFEDQEKVEPVASIFD